MFLSCQTLAEKMCHLIVLYIIFIINSILCCLFFLYDADAKEAKQTIKWRGLELEQLKHIMLGNRVYIWFDDWRTGTFLTYLINVISTHFLFVVTAYTFWFNYKLIIYFSRYCLRPTSLVVIIVYLAFLFWLQKNVYSDQR